MKKNNNDDSVEKKIYQVKDFESIKNIIQHDASYFKKIPDDLKTENNIKELIQANAFIYQYLTTQDQKTFKDIAIGHNSLVSKINFFTFLL